MRGLGVAMQLVECTAAAATTALSCIRRTPLRRSRTSLWILGTKKDHFLILFCTNMTFDMVETLLRMKCITLFDNHGIFMTNLLHQITFPRFKLYVYGSLD